MRHDDRQLGKPQFLLKDTQANINLITGSGYEGEVAYATDTGLLGHCVGNSWVWEREVLNADRTYYVSTGGNDSNNGLATGTSFLTIQKAINVASALDGSIYNVTIQVANGTYVESIILKSYVGSGTITILGNAGTPSNVIIDGLLTSDNFAGKWSMNGLKLQRSATAGAAISIGMGVVLTISNLIFHTGFTTQLQATNGGNIHVEGNYTISGGCTTHMYATTLGKIIFTVNGVTITITGTPNWTAQLAGATNMGLIRCYSSWVTITGAATGKRYLVTENSVIQTLAGGASYFPGDSAGSVATGGQYA